MDVTFHHHHDPTFTETWDCYCRHCRMYHGSVFGSFVAVKSSDNNVVVIRNPHDSLRYYPHTCDAIRCRDDINHNNNNVTVVERMFCSYCYSKLATVATTTTTTTATTTTTTKCYYINLSSLVESTIPPRVAQHWQQNRIPQQVHQMVPWYPPQPPEYPSEDENEDDEEDEEEENDEDEEEENDDEEDEEEENDEEKEYDGENDHDESSSPVRGGCACGRVRYRISAMDVPNELPICYCRLCRYMHGTAFVPWIYITHSNWQWIVTTATDVDETTDHKNNIHPISGDSSTNSQHHHQQHDDDDDGALKLIRTTSFGQRHVCTYCGVVLTIVYDKEQDEYIWPTAASMDYYYRDQRETTVIDDPTTTTTTTVHPICPEILQSVRHIYCQDVAPWYQIPPDDGFPRSYDE